MVFTFVSLVSWDNLNRQCTNISLIECLVSAGLYGKSLRELSHFVVTSAEKSPIL